MSDKKYGEIGTIEVSEWNESRFMISGAEISSGFPLSLCITDNEEKDHWIDGRVEGMNGAYVFFNESMGFPNLRVGMKARSIKYRW